MGNLGALPNFAICWLFWVPVVVKYLSYFKFYLYPTYFKIQSNAVIVLQNAYFNLNEFLRFNVYFIFVLTSCIF